MGANNIGGKTASPSLGIPWKVSIVALLLALGSIIGALLIGYYSYKKSLSEAERNYYSFYLRQAGMLKSMGQSLNDLPDDQFLQYIEMTWNKTSDRPDDEYICVVNTNSDLILHSSHPETVGKYAGKNTILNGSKSGSNTLGQLVIKQEEYVGGYVSSSGQQQVAAFVPVNHKGWVLGVHRSKEALHKEISENFTPFLTGFFIVCAGLMPLSIVLLFLTFFFGHRKRLQVELALNETEKLWRYALEGSGDGIWEWTPKTNKTVLSKQWKENLGYTDDEFANNRDAYLNLVHPDDIDQVEKQLHEVVENSKPSFHCEFRMKTKQNNWKWFLGRGKIISWNDDGTPDKIVGTHTDISVRRVEEEERIRLATAVMQAAESIIITDVNGNFEYVNPSFERDSGYNSEEIIGKHFNIQQIGLHEKDYYRKIQANVEQGKTWKGHLNLKNKNGNQYDVEATYAPITNKNGELVNTVVVMRDITQELRMEEQSRQSQKMEAMGTLAGGIAHDFNNILGAIIGYSDLAIGDLDDPHAAGGNIKEVLRAADRATMLVQQILSFSRQSKKEKKPIRINEIAKEAIKFLRASLPSTIEIRQSLLETNDIIVGDATQIHQVILNLCTNASQAMKNSNGKLIIEVTEHLINGHDLQLELPSGAYVKLSISDTGEGMSDNTMARIFDPYFTTKEKGEGTGLGLSVVHGIVKDHGGAIKVFSKPATGSTFNVYIPRAKSASCQPERTGAADVPIGTERILVVDDEEILANLLESMLTRLGYSVTTTTNSQQAVDLFTSASDQYDLIITDKTMPFINGFEVAGKITECRPDIPIILCTGLIEQTDNEKISQLGINAVLQKPISKKVLAKTIRKTLDDRYAHENPHR